MCVAVAESGRPPTRRHELRRMFIGLSPDFLRNLPFTYEQSSRTSSQTRPQQHRNLKSVQLSVVHSGTETFEIEKWSCHSTKCQDTVV
ncbi:unnamed protein product [Pleuronectes platessa]|uniref:Uncharacterized protein n=1 Tax=Pleuronectes platessa TaxID=8262 RepID=A0A9N7VF18_PLEPL|nr:unnamed protein product [Pleuronectes platessa]